MNFIQELEHTFAENASPENAYFMEKYMKNLFAYFGIGSEKRKALLNPLWKLHHEEIASDCRGIALKLMKKPQRELQYCGVEILQKELKKNYRRDDIKLIRTLLTANSWWDTVDFLSKHVLGDYLMQFPAMIPKVVAEFSSSDIMWLKRAAIIFQLGYKDSTDSGLLFDQCRKHAGSKEFFIRKAIGWALREYGKTDPDAVRDFVAATDLSPMSKREALKNL